MKNISDLLELENELRQNYPIIVGLDEVGRGPLAGPVVAAAVVLPANTEIEGVTDSKKIPKNKHRELVDEIMKKAIVVRVGVIDAQTIDQVNVLEADKLAMMKAIEDLPITPDLLLIDGNNSQLLPTAIPQQTLVKGDSKSLSIAAASLVAKLVRDTMMTEYSKQYPGYGFENNSGYGTKQHIEALKELGITPIHRLSFAPIKNNLRTWPRNNGVEL